MGGGTWSDDAYKTRVTRDVDAGKPMFAYDAVSKATPAADRKAHDKLNPLGLKLRESRDSDAHPESRAVTVILDTTGSMHTLPEIFVKNLPQLMGLIIRKGYLAHPQVMFGAINDLHGGGGSSVPLQLGQWESDVNMADDLRNLLLEGGGGGTNEEDYELAIYTLARKTSMDCLEKRGDKGYLFIVGDEKAYNVEADAVKRFIGDTLQADIPFDQIMAEALEKFEIYFILPKAASNGSSPTIVKFWDKYIGQRVIHLDDPNALCETIACAIGMNEGLIDADGAARDLHDVGSGDKARSVSTALATLSGSKAVAKGKTSGGTLAASGSGSGLS